MSNVHGIGGPRQRGDNPQSEPTCMDKVKEIWGYVPFFCRVVLYLCLFFYLSIFFTYAILAYSINFPQFVIFKLQIWRLVTSPYAHVAFLNLLIALLVFLMRAHQIEKVKGTAKYAIHFLSISLAINILATLIGIAGKHTSSFYSFKYSSLRKLCLWTLANDTVRHDCGFAKRPRKRDEVLLMSMPH